MVTLLIDADSKNARCDVCGSLDHRQYACPQNKRTHDRLLYMDILSNTTDGFSDEYNLDPGAVTTVIDESNMDVVYDFTTSDVPGLYGVQHEIELICKGFISVKFEDGIIQL